MIESYVIINNEKINIKIYTKENNKNIVFSVKKGYVYISKPRYVSCEKVKKLLDKNKETIYSSYKKVNNSSLANLDYILYNGSKRKLNVVKVEKNSKEKVEIIDDNIYVFVYEISSIKRLLINFYKINLEKIIVDKLKYYLDIFNKDGYNIYFNKVRTSYLKSRWGSCSYTNKNLNFNVKMMMLPSNVIDYILVHELSHLIEPNHSKKFWKIVERYCNEYKYCNRYLKENYHLFLYLD